MDCVVIIGELSVGKSALCRKFFSNGSEDQHNNNGGYSSSKYSPKNHKYNNNEDMLDGLTDEELANRKYFCRILFSFGISQPRKHRFRCTKKQQVSVNEKFSMSKSVAFGLS